MIKPDIDRRQLPRRSQSQRGLAALDLSQLERLGAANTDVSESPQACVISPSNYACFRGLAEVTERPILGEYCRIDKHYQRPFLGDNGLSTTNITSGSYGAILRRSIALV